MKRTAVTGGTVRACRLRRMVQTVCPANRLGDAWIPSATLQTVEPRFAKLSSKSAIHRRRKNADAKISFESSVRPTMRSYLSMFVV